MNAALAWLRRQIAFSNSRAAWKERAGFTALAVLGAGGWWLSRNMPLDGRLMLLGLWLVLACVLMRAEIIHVLGPVFFFEMLRGSRRRLHLYLFLYPALLLCVLTYIYLLSRDSYGTNALRRQAELSRTIFLTFFIIQMLLVSFLTPAVVAGCISEEKERRTLEFVLATDLRGSEILFGKLAARVAGLLMLMLAGLPVLSFIQFFGGITPEELLVATFVSVVTLLSISVVSITASVFSRRSRDAIFAAFVLVISYLVFSGAAQLARKTDFGRFSVSVGATTVSVGDLIDAIGAGNPIVQTVEIVEIQEMGAPYVGALRDMMRDYAIFHGVLAVLLLTWALWRLRPIALRQSPGGRSRRKRRHRLPAIGNAPMRWKEIHAEPGLRLHFILRVILVLVILGSFAFPCSIIIDYFFRAVPTWHELLLIPFTDAALKYDYNYYGNSWALYLLQKDINIWVRLSMGLIGILFLLAVNVRAAGSITGERAKHTFDELLTTPLQNREIIDSKLLGSIFGVRRGFYWVGAILAVGLLAGGVNILGLVAVAIFWFAFAFFFAALGTWFSTTARTTLRATVYSLVFALIALGGHWLFTALFCCFPLDVLRLDRGDAYEAARGLLCGLTPPIALGFSAMRGFSEFDKIKANMILPVFLGFWGPIIFLLAGLALRMATIRRFAIQFNRTNLRRPERRQPPSQLPQ